MTMGVVVLLLIAVVAISPPRRGRVHRGLPTLLVPAAGAVFVAVVLGGPVLGLVHQLPYMSANAFGRSRFIISLVVALVAGTGLDRLVELRRQGSDEVEEGKPDGFLRAGAVSLLVTVSLGTYIAGSQAIVDGASRALARDLALLLLAGVVLLVSAALLSRVREARVVPIALAVTVALAVELQAGAWGFVSTGPRAQFYPDPAFAASINQDIESGGGYRFTATSLNPLPPHAAAYLDLADLRVSYPAFEPWRQLVERVDPAVFDRRRLRTVFTETADWSSPVLDRLSTRYLMDTLRNPVLESTSLPDAVPIASDGTFTLPAGTAVRGFTVTVETGDCAVGWFELRVAGQLVTRRLARELAGPSTFPLPDIDSGGDAQLVATGCEVVLGPEATLSTPSGPLRVVSTDGLVVYERPSARPRADLATDVVTVLSGDVLDATSDLPATTAVVSVELDVAASVQGTVTFVDDDPDRVALMAETDGPALVVLRDIAAPGWNVTVDGRAAPTVAVDHALRGVVVPAGRHDVVFSYWPRTLTYGLFAALAGLAIALTALILIPRQRSEDGGESGWPQGP